MDYIDKQIVKIVSEKEMKLITIKQQVEKVINHKIVKSVILGGVFPRFGLIGLATLSGIAVFEIINGKKITYYYISKRNADKYFKFPDGSSVINSVYVANPKINTIYYPFNKFHHYTFQHRFSELLRIFQSLGVTELKITQVHGNSQEAAFNTEASFVGEGGGIGFGKQKKSNMETFYEASYEGHNEPFLPENLVWYSSEFALQEVVESRLKRTIKHFSLQISYEEDWGINHNLHALIKKSKVGLNGKFEANQNYVLNITGKFL